MKGRKGRKSLLWDSAEVKHIGLTKQKKNCQQVFLNQVSLERAWKVMSLNLAKICSKHYRRETRGLIEGRRRALLRYHTP